VRFLGIDLGWSSGASGVCCLEWQSQALDILDLDCFATKSEVLDWVDVWLPGKQPGMIAVDAPTVIPNPTGMRLCDRQAHRYFGRYHAGCYPANQRLGFAAQTVGFGLELEKRGFEHAPTLVPQQPGRYQIEVFPHAAMVRLFDLNQIIKYKKGRLLERQQGLEQLRQAILHHLPRHSPPLVVQDLPPIPETGAALKHLEDRLDSLVCAYTAAYWWAWGLERNWVLGGLEPNNYKSVVSAVEYLSTGYIVIPNPQEFAYPT
jgi:predicted RNase H-like nuclease